MQPVIFILQEEDAGFFGYKETNKTHVSLVLAQSLEDLVDAEAPRNLLKFRVSCESGAGDSLVNSTAPIFYRLLVRCCRSRQNSAESEIPVHSSGKTRFRSR